MALVGPLDYKIRLLSKEEKYVCLMWTLHGASRAHKITEGGELGLLKLAVYISLVCILQGPHSELGSVFPHGSFETFKFHILAIVPTTKEVDDT